MTSAGKIGLFVALLSLLASCTGWDVLPPWRSAAIREDVASAEDARAALALATLPDLGEADVLFRLDNSLLGDQMAAELTARAQEVDAPSIRDIRIDFGRQLVRLAARLDLTGPDGVSWVVRLTGDIRLAFSGNHLIWLPQFHHARVQGRSRDAAADVGPDAAELARQVERINREITDAIIIQGKHTVYLNPVPLGRLEVGGAMQGFPEVSAKQTYRLGGVFTVAGSAILIEPGVTSVALDLEFVPNISSCTADLTIGRAGFARAIEAREPVGVSRYLEADANIRHYYTEVKGARKSTVIVHYWFADGKPAGLEELPVEPSARWRTWSSKTIDRKNVRNWEVVVVERDTGCILHSQAIRAEPDAESINEMADTSEAWPAYHRAFERRLSAFSIMAGRPRVAQIEIRRDFLANVLTRSLEHVQVDSVFDLDGQSRGLQAGMRPFAAKGIVCESRDCDIQRSCDPVVSRCLRQHDTRDCTTCLFRNPLNNRCVNEAEDPICVAAREAQNDAYEAARQACLREERSKRLDCERLRAQEIRSCEIEAASAVDQCEASREALRRHQDAESLAAVTARVAARGTIVGRYSAFEVGEDLRSLAMSVEFRSQAGLAGSLSFRPDTGDDPLGRCLSAWQAPFEVQLNMPAAPYRLIGKTAALPDALVTEWSGIVVAAQSSPSPLEALFIEHPGMLADCRIGLRVSDVAEALTGEAAGFFRGALDIVFKPAPSRVVLAPASVEFGDARYGASPVLDEASLRFDITERGKEQ